MMADPDTLVNISELMPLPGHENLTQEYNYSKNTWHQYTVLMILLVQIQRCRTWQIDSTMGRGEQ